MSKMKAFNPTMFGSRTLFWVWLLIVVAYFTYSFIDKGAMYGAVQLLVFIAAFGLGRLTAIVFLKKR